MSLLYLAILVISGFLCARLLKRFGLPEICGYLLVGLALGPSWLHVLHHQAVVALEPLATFCLATIFFLLGEEFDLDVLRRMGVKFLTMTVVQSLLTCGVVMGLLLLAGAPLPVALLLGAIAGTSDPAATLAVIRETGAKGELPKTLLSIVALNGFVEMALLALLMPIVGLLHPGSATGTAIVLDSIREMAVSAGLGLALGYVLRLWAWRANEPVQLPAIGAILLGAGAATAWHLSMPLVMLAFGATVANVVVRREAVFKVARQIEGPLLAVFFAIAGARLNLHELMAVGGFGVLYVIGRIVGKLAGGSLGATLVGAAPACRRYLGCGLIPQAGLAIGLAVVLQDRFPDLMGPVMPIVLGSIIVFEATGPLLTRLALWRSGAIPGTVEPEVQLAPVAPQPQVATLPAPEPRGGWYDTLPGRYPVPVWRAQPPKV